MDGDQRRSRAALVSMLLLLGAGLALGAGVAGASSDGTLQADSENGTVSSIEHPEEVPSGSDYLVRVTVDNLNDAERTIPLSVDADEGSCDAIDDPTIEAGGSETVGTTCSAPIDGTVDALTLAVSTSGDDRYAAVGVRPSGGEIEWRSDGGASTSMTVAHGAAYYRAGDTIYATDAETGETLWSYEHSFSTHLAPTVADGTVYAGSDYSGNGTLVAIHAGNGTLRWNESYHRDFLSMPSYENGTVYLEHDYTTSIHALDAATGATRWSVEWSTQPAAKLIAVDDRLYYRDYGGDVQLMDAESGEAVWTDTVGLSDTQGKSLSVSNGTAYVGRSDLVALDVDSREELWVGSTEEDVASFPPVDRTSFPAAAGDTVYVGAEDLYAFDAETGEELWRLDPGSAVAGSPTVAGTDDPRVFFGTEDGELRAVSARDGTELWSVSLGDTVDVSPTVADGTVYVSGDGRYAIDAGVNGSSYDSAARNGPLGHVGDEALDDDRHGRAVPFEVTIDDAPDAVEPNATVSVNATVANDGLVASTRNVELTLDGAALAATNVSVDRERTKQVTLEGRVPRGLSTSNASLRIESERDAAEREVAVEPPCTSVSGGETVCDLTVDGNYRDVNGDGSVTNSDVTTFFANQHTLAWNERADLFDFDGNGAVGQSDVIALFEYVTGSG